MGIVFNQSYKNIVIIIVAIIIGGFNTLFFYPTFLKAEYYGLVVFLLATSNLLMPLVSFGSQHTIIKYFSSYKLEIMSYLFANTCVSGANFGQSSGTFKVTYRHDIKIENFKRTQLDIVSKFK